jgi:uncharacterized membrane protein
MSDEYWLFDQGSETVAPMTGAKVGRAFAACCVTAIFLAVPTGAYAKAAPVAVSSSEVSLTPGSGGLSGSIDVFSLSQKTVTLTAKSVDGGCAPLVGTSKASGNSAQAPVALKSAQEQTVTIVFPDSCAGKNATKVTAKTSFGLFAQEVGGAAAAPILMSVSLTPTPEWDDLLGFAGGLAGGFVLVFVAYSEWKRLRYGNWRNRAPEGLLLKPLKGLGTSWTFSGSWASNVTAGSGLLVAIVGSSDFLKATLSDNATAALSIATVAGLIGPAVIAGAGVCTATFKRKTDTTSDVSALGFLLGTALALGAAGGQVATLFFAVEQAGIGIVLDWVLGAGCVFALFLLAGYGWTSIISTLILGFGSKAARTGGGHPKAKVTAAAEKLTEAATREPAAQSVHRDEIRRILSEELPIDPPAGANRQELSRRSALP